MHELLDNPDFSLGQLPTTLLVGPCPLCSRDVLHQHPIPLNSMLSLLKTLSEGESPPPLEEIPVETNDTYELILVLDHPPHPWMLYVFRNLNRFFRWSTRNCEVTHESHAENITHMFPTLLSLVLPGVQEHGFRRACLIACLAARAKLGARF